MLQIIDISTSVSLNKKIVENKMLEVINATTSHELRNPLNSLITQNIKKAALYKEIKMKCENKSDQILDEISSIVDELQECNMIQNSSGKIMTFLIQDLLDFA